MILVGAAPVRAETVPLPTPSVTIEDPLLDDRESDKAQRNRLCADDDLLDARDVSRLLPESGGCRPTLIIRPGPGLGPRIAPGPGRLGGPGNRLQ